MSGRAKLLVSALVAMLSLMAFTSLASALRGFEITPQAITGTDPETTFASSSGNVICAVTLEGSIHRTIAKVEGTLAGYVTRGRVNEAGCTDTIEAATVQGELGAARFPWHIRYCGFTGELPNNIATICGSVVADFILNVRTIFGTTRCRYSGTIRLTVELAGGRARRIRATGPAETAQGFPCVNPGTIVGNYTLRPEPAVRLI